LLDSLRQAAGSMGSGVRGIPRMRITMQMVEEKNVVIGCRCLDTIFAYNSL
jgi:hypothetical protein